ncbi:MAG: hypothetical protein Q8R02_22395 [Hyphomonadaceae bacterium]|nr:hypothetical protein [Hyphomonadaceae bacterium]
MADGDEAPLAVETVGLLALEDGIVEHQRGADEIDTVVRHVLPAARFFPLEH